MTSLHLLAALRSRGVRVTAEGGDLLLWPRQLVTPAEVEALRRHKPALLRLLGRAVPRCQACGAEVLHPAVRYCQHCTWDEAYAHRLLREAVARCARAYQNTGAPRLDSAALTACEQRIDMAFKRRDLPALRRALVIYQLMVCQYLSMVRTGEAL